MFRRFLDDLPRHLATHLLGLFGAGQALRRFRKAIWHKQPPHEAVATPRP